jgi:hypothetical protein
MKPSATMALAVLVALATACQQDYNLYSTRCQEPCYTGFQGTEGVGECRMGWPICEDGFVVSCEDEILPSIEWCDARDNNCNGETDEEALDTGLGTECGSLVGECSIGYMQCVEGGIECVGAVFGTEEICNGLDDDCNGLRDDMGVLGYCYEGADEDLWYGECHAGILVCEDGLEVCTNQQLPETEVCDELDNDCDGFVDEDLSEGDVVDIVFIIDRSGSMGSYFSDVADAAQLFANAFTGVPEFRFALVGLPGSGTSDPEVLLDFTDAATFQIALSTVSTLGAGQEPSYDACQQAATGELGLSWREGSRQYQVLFTDEIGQSYADPLNTEAGVAASMSYAGQVFYAFIKSAFSESFDDIAGATGGRLFYLGNAAQMEDDLSEMFAQECW